MSQLPRRLAGAFCLAALATGCTDVSTLEPRKPMGDFQLGFNVVVADKAQMVPPSRKAAAAEWESLLKREVERRLGRYEGARLYHLGVAVTAYALAIPGIPLVFSPKSALILRVNVWDDAAQEKLTETPKELVVLESLSPQTLLSSGLTQDRDRQMRNLAYNAARQIEGWLAANADEWFGEADPDRDAAPRERPEVRITVMPLPKEPEGIAVMPLEEPRAAGG